MTKTTPPKTYSTKYQEIAKKIPYAISLHGWHHSGPLPQVVPFLEVTVHQDYLLHRLRELAAGGAISAYRWNAGSTTFNGRPWKEEYPTDTAVIAVVLATRLNFLFLLFNSYCCYLCVLYFFCCCWFSCRDEPHWVLGIEPGPFECGQDTNWAKRSPWQRLLLWPVLGAPWRVKVTM